MQKLTLGVPGNAVGPAFWLDACAKMMNTAVVLLMDKVTLPDNDCQFLSLLQCTLKTE